MKNAIIVLLAFVTLNISAQDHYIGLQTGMNISNVNQRLINADPLVGFSGGLTYKGVIQNHFLIGTDVLYAQRGFKTDFNFAIPGFNVPAIDIAGVEFQGINFPGFDTGLAIRNIKNRSEYISVPIKVGYIGGNKLKGYAQVGVAPSFLLSSKVSIPVWLINDIDIDVTRYTNKVDWAGLAEAGVIYDLNERTSFMGSVNYQQSFTPYYNGILETFSGSRGNNVNLSIGLSKKF